MARASRLSRCSSSPRWNALALAEDSRITIARPTETAVRKKNAGRSGEYQSGCNLAGMMRKSEPKDDWCRVDSTTPRITSGSVMACRICNGRSQAAQERNEDHRVPQEAGQDRRPEDGPELFQVQDVDDGRHGECAGAERHAAEQIEADPDAPGIRVVQIADGTDAEGVADQGDDEPDHDESPQDQDRR